MFDGKRTFRRRAAGFLLSAGMLVTVVQHSRAYADAVSDWNGVGLTTATNAGRLPNAITFDLTYVHVAIYDAVNAIDGRYTPFAVQVTDVPPGASQEAATAAAAYTVLTILYPSQQASLDPLYDAALAAIPDGPARDQGIAIGREVATRFMALRANDGRDAAVPYAFRSGPGAYQVTPGAPAPPASPAYPWLAKARPFALERPDQFRPDGPPDLDSRKWAEVFNETRTYGALNDSLRTLEQTEIGLFYTESPGAWFSRNVRTFAATQAFSLADSARFFAQLYVTVTDALIAAWDGKYHFNFWRPVTAIRAGDTDGREDTVADPGWLPLAVTPNHPEYPAAHGCFTGSYATFLRLFFKTKKVHITLSSKVTNTERPFDNTDDLIAEIINARVYGGMHYRSSVEDGVGVGKSVARWVANYYFRPVQPDGDEDQEETGLD